MTFNHDGTRTLLTEGDNDCHVILALCKHYKVDKTFGFNACTSDDLALKKLTSLLARNDQVEIIGIVIDADNPNLASKWQAVKDRLQKSGINSIPEEPNQFGTIIPAADGNPKVGIWLMPNNRLDGMLEDFCNELVDNPKCIEFVTKCVEDAKDFNYATFIEQHKTKAVIHTFLAWQNIPGMPLGQAITASILNPDNDLAQTFINWLNQLFNK